MLEVDALGMGVDVGALAAHEADEGLAEAIGRVDREARRRRDRAHDRDAGDRRLLHDLEADPARHHQHGVRRAAARRSSTRVPDQLVERVVPADVLAHGDELAVGGEQRRRRGDRRSRRTPSARRAAVRAAMPPPTVRRAGPAPTGAQCCSTSSRVVLPHSPQLALATNTALGRVEDRPGAARTTVTTLYSCSPSPARQYATVSRSSATVEDPLGEAEADGELEVVARACAW